MTTTTRITKMRITITAASSILLATTSLFVGIALGSLTTLVTVYAQPTPSPQCESGFTFNRGVCEQPASSFLTCPEGDDPESEGDDYILEENEEGILVCNLYETITEPAKINEETAEPYCDSPFKLIIKGPEGSDQEIFCLYRFLSDTVEPIPQAYCEDEDATLNTETNTCQMRPGQAPTTTVCVVEDGQEQGTTQELTQQEINTLEREGATVTEGQCPAPSTGAFCVSIDGGDPQVVTQEEFDELVASGSDVEIVDDGLC